MTDAALRALVVDALTRVRDSVHDLTDGLDEATATYRPAAEANPIGWLIWHLTRVQDGHLADLAGEPELWPRWRERFALPYDDDATGYDQSAAEVSEFRADPALLDAYQSAVHEASVAYAERLDEAELARIVDTRWDPPVTAAVRLVSVVDDIVRHIGQAEYVYGLAGQAGVAR